MMSLCRFIQLLTGRLNLWIIQLSNGAKFAANYTTFLSYIVAMITEQYGNNIAFEQDIGNQIKR